MSLTKLIKKCGEEIGLDIVKITSAKPLKDTYQAIKKNIKEGLIPICDPKAHLPEVKSVIVAGQCYLTDETPKNEWPYGIIAPYTRSNYYYDTRQKLKKLALFIEKKINRKLKYKVFSNGPLAEKPLAQKAGIGFYGKNGIIYSKQFGSWIVLGELLVNIELDYDKPANENCGNCRICIDACPARAIAEPYAIDHSKCLDYLMKKNVPIPAGLLDKMGKMTYGCTICQDVCPRNKIKKFPNRKPAHGYIGPSVNLIEILKLSENQFKEKFKNNQIGAYWVPYLAIKRNAIINLVNWKKSTAKEPDLGIC